MVFVSVSNISFYFVDFTAEMFLYQIVHMIKSLPYEICGAEWITKAVSIQREYSGEIFRWTEMFTWEWLRKTAPTDRLKYPVKNQYVYKIIRWNFQTI